MSTENADAADAPTPLSSGSAGPQTAANAAPPRGLGSWLVLALRLWVGGTFVWMGLNKAFDPVDFLKLLRTYEVLPEQPAWILNGIAGVLPWLEIWCGALLVAGIAVRGAAALTLIMLTVFTAALAMRAVGIQEADQIAFCEVAFDCGCGKGAVPICSKLAENAGLWIGALCVLLSRRPRWTLN